MLCDRCFHSRDDCSSRPEALPQTSVRKCPSSSSHISAIETGSKPPSLETLLEFCKVLNINIDYLLNGTIHNELDKQLIEKIKLCSLENQKRISKIVDVFLEEEKLEK